MRAHRHRRGHLTPGDDAPRSEDRGRRADGIERRSHLGHQHHRCDLAAMTARFAARNDKDIDPGADLRQRMIAGADERGNRHTMPFAEFEHQLWRYTERVGDQANRMAKRNFEQLRRAFFMHIVAEALPRFGRSVEARRIDAEFVEHIGRKAEMRLGHARRGRRRCLALAGEAVGDDEVDTIGLAADVRVDPRKLFLKSLGRQRGGAEHTHAAGFRHRDDDVPAVRKGEQRKFDAEHGADGRLHVSLSNLLFAPMSAPVDVNVKLICARHALSRGV